MVVVWSDKHQTTKTAVNGLKCMYTNLDCFSNKKPELMIRIADLKPDIIGLTEVNPKNARWEFTDREMAIPGYIHYSNLHG